KRPHARLARRFHLPCSAAVQQPKAGGSLVLVKLLTFEADPIALVLVASAERGGHHGHTAAWADRRAVVPIHAPSLAEHHVWSPATATATARRIGTTIGANACRTTAIPIANATTCSPSRKVKVGRKARPTARQ